MATLLQQIVSPPGPCPYLPDRHAEMESKLMLDVTPEELEQLLIHGWRRFGPTYFHPVCQGCMECVSLRIPVTTFKPTRSQRRARNKCWDIHVEVGTPRVDEERLQLYHAWHASRESTRGWDQDQLDEERYFLQFAFPHPCAREFAYYQDSTLVAVGLTDVTPRALSSVYFYFHPDHAWRSLGVASLLFEVEWACRHNIDHVYVGYRVLDCPSLRYKATFGPHELLEGRPPLHEPPVWKPAPRHADR